MGAGETTNVAVANMETYFGYPFADNVVQSGPYQGEVVAECVGTGGQKFVPVITDEAVVYDGDMARKLRGLFDWTGPTGTSHLFFDKSRRIGSLCIDVTDPKQNEMMLERLEAQCRTPKTCDPVKRTIKANIPSHALEITGIGIALAGVLYFCHHPQLVPLMAAHPVIAGVVLLGAAVGIMYANGVFD